MTQDRRHPCCCAARIDHLVVRSLMAVWELNRDHVNVNTDSLRPLKDQAQRESTTPGHKWGILFIIEFKVMRGATPKRKSAHEVAKEACTNNPVIHSYYLGATAHYVVHMCVPGL
jgi:hypothetical protein